MATFNGLMQDYFDLFTVQDAGPRIAQAPAAQRAHRARRKQASHAPLSG